VVAAVVNRPNPPLRRLRLGGELRRLREASGSTIEQASRKLYCSASKISRIETARVSATIRDVENMLDLYRASDHQREVLITLARDALQEGARWHAYGESPDIKTFITYETAAQRIRLYEALLIPGLLQVEEYARLVIGTAMPWLCPEDVERHVKLRLHRQELLAKDDSPILSVVLDEAVLHRLKSNRSIMQKQLNHLIEVASMPNVTFQVLRFTAGHHVGINGAFTILSFRDHADPDVVYLEHAAGDLYLSNPDQVRRHKILFKHLQTVSLEASRSIAFLVELSTHLS
jgi:transcriptional regulator with XRE-family HTH domain